MKEEFLLECFDNLLMGEVKSRKNADDFQKHIEILVCWIKSINEAFKNSKQTNHLIYRYIFKHLYNSHEKIKQNEDHFYIQELKGKGEEVILFSEVLARIIMLGVLCKTGAEDKHLEWGNNFKKLCHDCQLSLMFSQTSSFTELIVKYLQQMTSIFKQITFYEILGDKFEKLQFSYISNWTNTHLKEMRKCWETKQIENSKKMKRFKREQQKNNKAKQVFTQKITKQFSEADKLRLKEYQNKKRKSQFAGKSRTLYHNRKSMSKRYSSKIKVEEQIIYVDPETKKQQQYTSPESKKLQTFSVPVMTDDEDILAWGTPSRR